MSNIFRAYDVRGIYPEEINTDTAKKVGNAVARYLKAKTIVVGEDGRIGSPELRRALIEGITLAGTDVIYIGQCTTPLFYFSVKQTGADGGIMVTASHNPPDYNGLKITSKGGTPLGIDEGLLKIKEYSNDFVEAINKGKVMDDVGLKDQYIDFLVKNSGLKMGTVKLKIALDAGNGMASLIIKPLFEKLAIDYIPLFFDINGSFPGRGSDPLGENALNPLKNAIINNNAELGIAFDGDADRMSVLDERGNIISPQFVLALLWQSIKSILSKPKVVYDSRFSRSVREFFGRQGIRSKVGHTNISRTMKDCRAAIGGETSGHFFFREMNYTESSALAVLRMLKVLSGSKKTISELVKPYDKYFYSGEVDVELLSNMDSNKILEMLKGKYENGRIDEFDGLTGDFSEWWFNVRSSNTEPLLRLVVEANTKELMDQKVSELVSEIKKAP